MSEGEQRTTVVQSKRRPKRPRKMALAWAAFGLFGFIAAAVGWQLGGDSYLGIGAAGTSAALFIYSIANYIAPRQNPWFLRSFQIDIDEGVLRVEEEHVVTGESRLTPLGLGDSFEDASIQELPGLRRTWAPTIETDVVYLRLPLLEQRGEAMGYITAARQAAESAVEQGIELERPSTGAFTVDRLRDRTVISWRQRPWFVPVLRIVGQVCLLIAATPLLTYAWGIPFGVCAALLGWRFALQGKLLKKSLFPVRRVEVSDQTLKSLGPGGQTKPIAEIGDVDAVSLWLGYNTNAAIDAQVDSRLDSLTNPVDWFAGSVDKGEEMGPEHLPKSALDIVGGLQRATEARENRWHLELMRYGFAETLELTLLIREELERVADWKPSPTLRPSLSGEQE